MLLSLYSYSIEYHDGDGEVLRSREENNIGMTELGYALRREMRVAMALGYAWTPGLRAKDAKTYTYTLEPTNTALLVNERACMEIRIEVTPPREQHETPVPVYARRAS